MPHPDMIILYVADLEKSTTFYTQILEAPLVQTEPYFALFALTTGLKLGIWETMVVDPEYSARPGAMEINIHTASRSELDALYQSWSQSGVEMLQAPLDMEFGYCFTALDPDGHRIRPLFR